MSIQMSANVDVACRQGSLQMSMEMSNIYDKNVNVKHPKIMPKTKNVKKCKCQAPEDDAQDKKYQKMTKKCQCRLKRLANVEHMSMLMVPPNVDPIWSTSIHTHNSRSLDSCPLLLFLKSSADFRFPRTIPLTHFAAA